MNQELISIILRLSAFAMTEYYLMDTIFASTISNTGGTVAAVVIFVAVLSYHWYWVEKTGAIGQYCMDKCRQAAKTQ